MLGVTEDPFSSLLVSSLSCSHNHPLQNLFIETLNFERKKKSSTRMLSFFPRLKLLCFDYIKEKEINLRGGTLYLVPAF